MGESAGSVFEFPVFEDVGSSFLEMSPVLRPSLLEVPFFGFVGENIQKREFPNVSEKFGNPD